MQLVRALCSVLVVLFIVFFLATLSLPLSLSLSFSLSVYFSFSCWPSRSHFSSLFVYFLSIWRDCPIIKPKIRSVKKPCTIRNNLQRGVYVDIYFFPLLLLFCILLWSMRGFAFRKSTLLAIRPPKRCLYFIYSILH